MHTTHFRRLCAGVGPLLLTLLSATASQPASAGEKSWGDAHRPGNNYWNSCNAATFTGHFKKKSRGGKRGHGYGRPDPIEVDGAEILEVRAQSSRGGEGAPVPFAGTPAPSVAFCEVEVVLTQASRIVVPWRPDGDQPVCGEFEFIA